MSVVLIKLADRLHNMRTLEHLKPDRQEAIARETLDIYAPLAHRLGMGKVRGELEDLAFRYTDPMSYEQVSAAVEARRIEGEQFLRGVEDTLVEQLRENGIQARVEWRIKRLYSIFQKIERTKVSFDQVYDLLAIRVITQDVAVVLRGLRAHSHAVAAGAGAHQGLYRHSRAPTAISRCTPP